MTTGTKIMLSMLLFILWMAAWAKGVGSIERGAIWKAHEQKEFWTYTFSRVIDLSCFYALLRLWSM